MNFFRNDKGSATIFVLLLSAVIITLAIGFNTIVREHMKAAEALKLKADSMAEAYSVWNELLFSLLAGKVTQKAFIPFKGKDFFGTESLPLNGTEIKVSDSVSLKIQDSNGLISLTTYKIDALKNLLKEFTQDEKATTFVDSFLDWIDRDDVKRLNGAERLDYEMEGLSWKPRNYPLQYKEEILLIRGMDLDLYKKIAPYVTILPNMGFNPNTAPDEVLMAYLNIDRESLFRLKEYLNQASLSSDSILYSLVGRRIVTEEGIYYFPSYYFEINICSGAPKPLYFLNVGIDLRIKLTKPYEIIYWKEE